MLRAMILALAIASPAAAASVAPVRAIRAQTVIAAADLTVEEEAVPGAVETIDAAAGLEARVTLYPGRPILTSQIGPPAIVERNQVVRMTFLRGPLAITADGRALDRGGAGDRVRVMNLGSKQIVTGAVADDGSIEVGQ
jgi:flagella basal body P-ring formation protein FlgA